MPLFTGLLACLVACSKDEEEDSGPPEDTEEPDEYQGPECDVPELRVTGSDAPIVGDTWVVWMWCDDVLLTGAMRLSFEPVDFATIADNNATFLYAGAATMQLQVGSRRQTRDVTVTE